jgi:heat shock protein HslJ
VPCGRYDASITDFLKGYLTKQINVMKKIIIISLLVVAVVAVIIACCPCRKGKNNATLTEGQWHVVRMMNHDLKITAEQFTFTFLADGVFAGTGGCNQINAQYTKGEKGELTFSNLVSTKMMCPDIELESTFNQILEGTTHYEMDGEMLMLFSNGEMQAVLKQLK